MKNTKRKWIVYIILALLVLLTPLAAGSALCWIFGMVIANIPSYEEQAMDEAEVVLQDLIANPNQFVSDDPSPFGNCWRILHEALVRNHEQYTLSVDGIYGKYGTPDSRPIGSTDSAVRVSFVDGTRIGMSFYNLTFVGCYEVTDDE
jgi:hypothetical protein